MNVLLRLLRILIVVLGFLNLLILAIVIKVEEFRNPVAFLSFAILLIILNRVFKQVNRKIAQTFDVDQNLTNLTDSYCFLLRSFKYDRKMGNSMFLISLIAPIGLIFLWNYVRTTEENIARIFKRKRLLLLSTLNYHESLQYTGSEKIKLESDWMREVYEIITSQRCKYVLLIGHKISDNLIWEFNVLIKEKLFHKMIVVLPEKSDDYEKMSKYFIGALCLQLPSWFKGNQCALVFDNMNNAILITYSIFSFSALPPIALAIKRALDFIERGHIILNPRIERKIGIINPINL